MHLSSLQLISDTEIFNSCGNMNKQWTKSIRIISILNFLSIRIEEFSEETTVINYKLKRTIPDSLGIHSKLKKFRSELGH